MNILFCNKFLYERGGAEVSMFETARLLKSKGHSVLYFSMHHPSNIQSEFSRYFVSNIEYGRGGSLSRSVKAAGRLLYSIEAKENVCMLLNDYPVDIVHLNNIAHQISPSIIHEFKKRRIPVVMSIRDYKLVCPSYTMLSNGKVCEDCKGGRYYRATLNRCHKGSFSNSLLLSTEMTFHKIIKIYGLVDVFISTTYFLKNKIEEMGFKGDIEVLPNFVNFDDYPEPVYGWKEPVAVYFGRLSSEKGLITLIEAFKGLDLGLDIIGDGPERESLLNKVKTEGISNIRFYPHQDRSKLMEKVSRSMFVIFPSEWYEPFGRTALESFALGKPVIGARIGGIPEMVKDNLTGYLFEPGNAADLRDKVTKLASKKDAIIFLGKNARKFAEERFNSEVHYSGLMEIYERASNKKVVK